MKKVLAATALAASLLAGSALPSFASTTQTQDLGTFATSDTVAFNRNGATGKFTDYFTFTLTNAATLAAASVTNSFTKAAQYIKDFTLSLYSGTVAGSHSLLVSNVAALPIGTDQTTKVTQLDLGTGKYYLQVTGTVGKASYGGSLAISSVPLPSTVALFGVAVAGLGVAGAMRRQTAASAA